MATFDLFSKRQKRLQGEIPDVYSYDEIPNPLRVQIVHIWKDALGDDNEYNDTYDGVKNAYKFIVETLCREYGVFKLSDNIYGSRRHYLEEFIYFFLHEEDTDKVLDAVELSFRFIHRLTRKYEYLRKTNASEIADNSIQELNERFREHGIGFQFEEGDIIRVDSQLLHSETVKPALQLLNTTSFTGAQQEFLNAYEHYRHGNHKEAMNEALKAFESTMKAVCDKRGWPYNPKDTSKKLIDICFNNGLIPSFWQQHMAGLRSLLEGGVPTGRNKLSGHGQGAKPVSVPDYLVSYILHMTAAAIIFIVKAEQDLK